MRIKADVENKLKPYPVTWQGQVILACKKCQKKLAHSGERAALSKLKKIVKRHNREAPHRQLHVINVPCMDICPKDGVTVYVPEGRSLAILRSEEDVHRLYVDAKTYARQASPGTNK